MAQIQVTNLTFSYEGSYDTIFDNVSFVIDTDWKLGFIGRNGKGKTTFLNLLLGRQEYAGGIHTSAVFDYFPYQIPDARMTECGAELMERMKQGCELWRVLCELEALELDAEILYRPFRTLSYGEQTKLMLVALLTRQYTGIESSSVTYEKANQLMEAVIYCIRELEQSGDDLLTSRQQSAMQAYEIGAQLVHRKTEDLLAFYERNKQKFSAYGNGYLADILQRGIPAFFENYDEKYDPQNMILTLDYPLLVDLTAYQGIDCVDLYVRSLAEEQRFLAKYGEEYVQSVLRSYSEDYEELPENIAGIVFGNIIGHLLAGRGVSGKLCGTDLQGIYAQYRFCERDKNDGFREKVSGLAAAFLMRHYTGAEQTQRYMMAGLPDICTRIGTAAAYGSLDNIFVF